TAASDTQFAPEPSRYTHAWTEMTEYNINLIRVVLFRTLQTLAVAAPTLLCGLLLAGAIRGMVGPTAVRRWFTDDPRIGPARAWLTGLLLPVCSFGVLPIAWEF